jgi:hypothetical protein
MKKNRPHDQREMIGQVRSHLQRRQKQPAIVQRFFHEGNTSAACKKISMFGAC